MRYIIVTAFKFMFSFLNFICIAWGPIISTQILFYGISSGFLTSNLPNVLFDLFVLWQVSK